MHSWACSTRSFAPRRSARADRCAARWIPAVMLLVGRGRVVRCRPAGITTRLELTDGPSPGFARRRKYPIQVTLI